MIVITGGGGFIGTNLVRQLLETRPDRLLIVEQGDGLQRAAAAWQTPRVATMEIGHFISRFVGGRLAVDAVVHLAARTDTLDPDGTGLLATNYRLARRLVDRCLERRVRLIYASSAAVYGNRTACAERPENEAPLNLYARSKWLLDRHVRQRLATSPVQLVGLRPFNVYGPHEAHKGRMASVVRQFHRQLTEHGVIRLFGASHGFAAGEQRRDFVHVDDLCRVIDWFLHHPDRRGIYNVGSGSSVSFNQVADRVITHRGGGRIDYTPFPEALVDRYQPATRAELGALREAGCELRFQAPAVGIDGYLDWLATASRPPRPDRPRVPA